MNFFTPYQMEASLTNYESLLGGNASKTAGLMNNAGLAMSIAGALQAGIGAFYSAQNVKDQLEFQAEMNAINARMAERTAQSILLAGQKEQGRISLKAGKVKGAQRASQAARGIALGEGNAAEEIATTDLMKEMDMYTINANAVRQAWAARTQSVNAANESLLQGVSAQGISPYMAAGTSLMNSGASVAASWYQRRGMNRLAAALGVE